MMATRLWYRASLSGEQIAAGHVAIIQRLFLEALTSADDSPGACLFAAREDGIFFSPASISAVPHLIAQYSALPSPPPDRADAALLVGTDADWEQLPRSTH
jgi:hypothetical protein